MDGFLDRNTGFLPPGDAAAGGGVTGSSDSSLTISGTDAIINRATAGAWTGAHTFTNAAVPVTTTITDGSAATQIEAARFRHLSSVTATAGIGAYASFWTSNGSAGGATLAESARVVGLLRTVTNGSESGVLLFQYNNAGTMANGGWVASGSVYATSQLGLGTLSATGTTTDTMTISVASTMINHKSSLAANGGHSFSGTVNTSGARQFFVITPSANTNGTASTEIQKFEYQTYTQTWATGALATQREFAIKAPTYAFAGASTITTAATVYIDQAPIAGANATITKGYSLWIDAGMPRIDSTTVNGTVATVLGSVGPTGSNTTVQEWLTVDINGNTRYIPCF